jgi:hypothetical protein
MNKHRMRYWLSVGATPTPGVARLLEKFDYVPTKVTPFGAVHSYEKPSKKYGLRAWRGMGRSGTHENKYEWYYKQMLQEQMNIVERKRRLTDEALSGAHAPLVPHEAATEEVGNETDGENSEEVDIFERKSRFERLQRKYAALRKEKGLLLKGNDLRSNIYLRKMEKLARQDLGLDIVGYKDYVHNIKRFAQYNTDLNILADDVNFKDQPTSQKAALQVQYKEDTSRGHERFQKFG